MTQQPKSFILDKDEEELTAPKSFISDEPIEEEHKPGFFSSFIPADRIHPGEGPKAKLDKFLKNVLTTDKHPFIKRFLTTKEPEGEPFLPSIKEAGIKEPDTFTGGFLKGLYDEFIRPLSSSSGMAGILAMGKTGPFHGEPASKIKDLSVRQPSREIPYKVAGDLPNSILEDIKQFSGPDVKTTVVDYIKKNPEAKMKDVEQFINSVKTSFPPSEEILTPEFAAKGEEELFNAVRTERVKKTFEGESSARYTEEDLAKAKAETERLMKSSSKGKREKFVNPFEKKVETVVEEKSPIIEEKLPIVEPPKPPITIDNAPPNQRAKMMRGAHEPIDILFGNSEDRELFGAGQSGFSKGVTKPNWADRFKFATDKVVKDYGVTEQEARTAITNYNAEIRKLGSAVDKEGGNITAPTFEEFIKGGEQELSGGLGGINPSSRVLKPNSGPYGKALDKLFESMGKISENRVQQDIINKTERARRFAKSAGVKDEGVKGAAQSLSALKGEFEKVDVEKLQMTQPQVDSLFTAVKRANITEGEKARGYTALFKLFNGEGVPQRNELNILNDVFGNDFASKVVEMHGGLGAVGLKISKIANTMKAMMASIDLSFGLRQGIGMIHKTEWRSAMIEQLKYFAKPEYYNAAMKAIESHPKYLLGKESGLFLAKHGSLTQGEEIFAHNYLGSLPSTLRMPFDASERAYTGGLNKLRSDLFNNLTKLAEKAGNEVFASKQIKNAAGELIEIKVPTKVAENIANYINIFTGRGGLGKLEPIANELNTVFWSPRLMTSRLTALNPKFYYDLDPFTRKEAIKSLFAIATASTTINALGAAAGAKVGYNILSSDFAKSRFSPSNNVLDPSGGFQQPIVAAARMLEELNRMSIGGKKEFNKPGIPGIAGNFLANKLSPLTSLAYDIASAKKFTGKEDLMSGREQYTDRFGNKKNILDETRKKFVPMFIQDVYDIVNSDPSFAETVGLLPLIALGAGEQNYPEKQKKGKFLFRKLSLKLR